ncbi:MAG: response regulator transcription factor [Lachnospiraceae bacterium]|nr:response regulator transcription factor [Lachnospiraceae bacterium]
MKDTVLIVEDDRDIMEVVTIMLGREGFKVLKATNGKEAIEEIAKRPDLIILDVMLPDMDGFTVCRRIRQESLAPVLFLTAKTGVQDKTEGLEAGGDDYLVKPFFQEELRARIRALLRRYENYRGKDQNEPRDHYMEVGRFRVSEDFNEVLKDGKQISMTDIEYRILKLLMQYRNKIFSIQNIYESVWEKPYFYDANNTVMVHIRRLRMAIEDDPKKPVYIRTEWGRGYRFVSE